jgi:hypothetical protein
MIDIKELLFKLLDELEPNQTLDVKVDCFYVVLANKNSILPLAIEMREAFTEEEDDMHRAYRDAFNLRTRTAYEEKFIADHTIVFNDKRYIIYQELLDMQFYDDYFSVTIATPEDTYTIYHKYNDINVIKVPHEKSKTIVDDYNALNYKFKSNK